MIIVGAGMAGLLAAAMLRGQVTSIIESQDRLPINHHALLRFPSRAVSDVTGIPFREAKVLKAVAPYMNPVAEAINYSYKNTGHIELRSIAGVGSSIEQRYIAPPDFPARLKAAAGQVSFGSRATRDFFTAADGQGALKNQNVISTIPMPTLMAILEWPYEIPDFNYVRGVVIKLELPLEVDIHVTLYVPDPGLKFSRVSITGRQLIIELPRLGMEDLAGGCDMIRYALALMGLPRTFEHGTASTHEQKYMKILPIGEAIRRRFMIWATDNFNIYSLGRFATWRPGLLLDDVVKDVRTIQRMMVHGNYKERLR